MAETVPTQYVRAYHLLSSDDYRAFVGTEEHRLADLVVVEGVVVKEKHQGLTKAYFDEVTAANGSSINHA